jgi:adenylate cyclase
MIKGGFKRKLTAILSADVKGYSRLMGEDEETTVRTITTYRGMMASLIQQYRGRVVDSPGDNLLAEFVSVVDAVQCAVEIQRVFKAKNAELPENRRMEFRIGINLGDVIEEGERIYGDGVNIAARIENLAEGGGICISGSAYEQIENKLVLGYEYLGEHTVKNIAKPVRVYRVPMEPRTVTEVSKEKGAGLKQWQRAALAVMVFLILGAGALAIWNFYLRPSPPPVEVASVEKMAFPLPDKPSIAVLPFVNMSGDPEQEYFSDGITEDIITSLSKIPRLFVIARNSTFTYKGKPVKVQQVSEDLGVRYVLVGSVRKAGDRVRITARLVNATTGGQLWAESYDRELNDIFAIQDEITQEIVVALKVEMREAELERVRCIPTDNLTAYDSFLRGMEYFSRFTKEANDRAQQMFERAIELDPEFAAAYAFLGLLYWKDWKFQWDPDPQALERAFELAQRAVALDDSLPVAHRLLGDLYLLKKQHEQAIAEAERAIALDPNDASGYATLGFILNSMGKPEKAIELLEKAMRLHPHFPFGYVFQLGVAYRLTGRYDEAISTQKKVLTRNPNFLLAYTELAANYLWQWIRQRSQDPQALEKAYEMAEKAISLNDSLPRAHNLLGRVYLFKKQHEKAINEAERAIALDPNNAEVYLTMGFILNYAGRPEEATDLLEKAMGLSPPYPVFHLFQLGHSYRLTGRYEDAIAIQKRILTYDPDFMDTHFELAILYSESGREEEARAEVSEFLRLWPNFSLETWRKRLPYKDQAVSERELTALRKAGLK